MKHILVNQVENVRVPIYTYVDVITPNLFSYNRKLNIMRMLNYFFSWSKGHKKIFLFSSAKDRNSDFALTKEAAFHQPDASHSSS